MKAGEQPGSTRWFIVELLKVEAADQSTTFLITFRETRLLAIAV